MTGFELFGLSVLAFVLAFVVPIIVGLWTYYDASQSNVPYPAPFAYGVTALFFAGLLPGIVGVIGYVSFRESVSPQDSFLP